jgi:hypothetical protein
MAAKTSCTTSCEAILSPPWVQWRMWIPIGSKANYKCNMTSEGLRDGKDLT